MTFYDDIPEIEPVIDGSDLQIGIVMSRFNLDISEGLLSACIIELRKMVFSITTFCLRQYRAL